MTLSDGKVVLPGSLLGSLLFSIFTTPVDNLVSTFGIRYHRFAYDTQLYTAIDATSPIRLATLSACADAVTGWHIRDDLLFNQTEAIVTGTRQLIAKLDQSDGVTICGGVTISLGSTLRVLRVTLDSTNLLSTNTSPSSSVCVTSIYAHSVTSGIYSTRSREYNRLFNCLFSSGLLQLHTLWRHRDQDRPFSTRPKRNSEDGLRRTISFVSNGTSTLISLAVHQAAHRVQSGDEDLQDPTITVTTVSLRTCRRLQTAEDMAVNREGPVG